MRSSPGEWPVAVRVGIGRILARYGADLAVEDTYLCRVVAGQIRECVDNRGNETELPATMSLLGERVIERSSLLMIDDLRTDAVVAEHDGAEMDGCFLGVGAFNEGGVLTGLLLARGAVPRSWSNRDLERAGDSAQGIASMLVLDELWRHADSRVQAEVRARELRRQMHTISARSASASSLPQLSRILVTEIPPLVEAGWAIVGIRHADSEWRAHVSPELMTKAAPIFEGSEPVGDALLEHAATLGLGRTEVDLAAVPFWPDIAEQLGSADSVRVVGSTLMASDDLSVVLLCGFASPESSLQVDRVFDETLEDVRRAVERTAAAQRQIEAASELQRSLLPPRVPDLAGFEIARLYTSAADHARVGGDWYDIVQIDAATTGFIVGDVAGHDLRSAAIMGQLRHVLASQLRDRGRPEGALLATDRYFADLAENVMATAVVIVVDQSTSTAHVALAGHPPPVVIQQGRASLLEAQPGPPIGFGYGGYRDSRVALAPGDSFIAYTDGVVETQTGNLAVLLEQFVAAVDASDANTVHEYVNLLRQRSQLGELVDDVAALVVEISAPSVSV